MPTDHHILVLSYTPLERDGRVQRQIRFLLELKNVAITVAAHGHCPIEDRRLRFLPLPRKRTLPRKLLAGIALTLRQYRWYDPGFGSQAHACRRLRGQKFDLIIANDVETLPAAFKLKSQSAKIILDAHEYEPRHYEDQLQFRLLVQPWAIHLCRRYLRELDGMMTVGEEIARTYERHFGAAASVVLNAPFYQQLHPTPTGRDRIDLIYHGVITKSRNPAVMLRLLDALDPRFHLNLMLIATDSRHHRQFVAAAVRHPRAHLVQPVPPGEIANTINSFDIGLSMLPPVNFNHMNAMPNKVLEFVQGRLALAVWPSPEIAALVQRHGLGIVSEHFNVESLAGQLNRLDNAAIAAFKSASHRVAKALSAETAGNEVRRMVRVLIGADGNS